MPPQSKKEVPVGILVQIDEVQAKARILSVFREEDGIVSRTANRFAVTKRTLDRWVGKLKIRKDVDAIRQHAGRRTSRTYNPGGIKNRPSR